MDCRLDATNDAGDHLIFIGEVLAIGVEPEAKPLIFRGGSYQLLRDGSSDLSDPLTAPEGLP
jgi:flavin reductase (DIM6/NTAB) family NADH-FMN oxidoreductase RutF